MNTQVSRKLTDPVNVVLAVVGVVVVDDELDVVHVEATGGNIGSNEDGCGTSLELAEDPVPLLLLLVAVDAHGRPAVLPHQPEYKEIENNLESYRN